jgi:hypothetical protein
MSYNLPTIAPMRAGSEKELRKQMPRLQTSPELKNSSRDIGASQMNPPPTATGSLSVDPFTLKSPTSASHQRFVLTDHIAFRYLEEDPSTTVLARRQKLEGYEIYLVEQWACSRSHPTFIITTFTGDPKDTAYGSIISVPADESKWSPPLRMYFKALDQYHARRKETSFGTLMITNLSAFPSSLTVIPVPEGDVKKNRELFFVNENLKRLGCSGRLGIKLAPPSSAAQAKFHQLYRTSDKIALNSSVIELVKLCQVALVMFGKLEPEYADGLLCDVTEKAINDWWVEFGAEYYTIEPHDGILGPTTVAALLGMYMGARNRLSAYNAPVAKDAFDIESMKRGVAYFQKTQRIQKTRRLDRVTLERLRRSTAKAASKEGWGMPKALKSGIAELGGKGGEMVMGIVGAGDKAGIADIETVDIDRFVDLVHGERAKWLWYGKPRKTNTQDMFSRLPGEDGSSPEERRSGSAKFNKKEPESEEKEHKLSKRDTLASTEEAKIYSDLYGTADVLDDKRDPNSKRAAIKRATGKIESGSGLHRIRDAVGRRNHHTKSYKHDAANGRLPLLSQTSDIGIDLAETASRQLPQRTGTDYEPSITKALAETPLDSESTLAAPVDGVSSPPVDESRKNSLARKVLYAEPESDSSKPNTVEPSIAGSVFRDIDNIDDKLPFTPTDTAGGVLLRRTQSAEDLTYYHAENRHEHWWPRHLSFSIAEESVLNWPPLTAVTPEDEQIEDLRTKLAAQKLLAEDAKRLQQKLAWLTNVDAQWTSTSLEDITNLDAQADADIQELESLYYPRLDTYQSLREDAHEIISRERLQLQESIRDLETLGAKLEYELNSLRGKVDDVDDGIHELERQVEFVEDRFRELENVVGEKESWIHWSFRILTGIGSPPG